MQDMDPHDEAVSVRPCGGEPSLHIHERGQTLRDCGSVQDGGRG